jgi:SpoVK/Ycf46/Vps4 family AAA+-type ATPase
MASNAYLYNLIKSGLYNDKEGFKRYVNIIMSQEKNKKNSSLYNQLEKLVNSHKTSQGTLTTLNSDKSINDILYEKVPSKKVEDLFLPENVIIKYNWLIKEHQEQDTLKLYSLEPSNKILLIGPPGNGKTSLAESIANSLSLPLYIPVYGGLIKSLLGETTSGLNKIFKYIEDKKCVLFFDEFDTLGKERSDHNEVGEIKRVVTSLILHMDNLPSSVIFIAATNHESILDSALWRRFHYTIKLVYPNENSIKLWLDFFEKRMNFKFGIDIPDLALKLYSLKFSFGEIEYFAINMYKRLLLKDYYGTIEEMINIIDINKNTSVEFTSTTYDQYC